MNKETRLPECRMALTILFIGLYFGCAAHSILTQLVVWYAIPPVVIYRLPLMIVIYGATILAAVFAMNSAGLAKRENESSNHINSEKEV